MYIKRLIVYLYGLFLFFGLYSCTKNEFTIPTNFNFKFKLIENKSVGNYLLIERGEAFLATIEFEGRRQNAPSYFFATPVNMKFNMNIDTTRNYGEMIYSIPQGIYSKINLSLGFLYSGSSTISANQAPLISFYGNYLNRNGIKVPLKIDFNFEKIIKLSAKNSFLQDTIIIKSTRNNKAEINFNPYYWFQVVSRSDLEIAEISQETNFYGILIDDEHNSKIYQLLVNRIEESTQAVFTY